MVDTNAPHGNVHMTIRIIAENKPSFSFFLILHYTINDYEHIRFTKHQEMICKFRFSLRVLHLLSTHPMLPTIFKMPANS